jgi:hypothetical protein
MSACSDQRFQLALQSAREVEKIVARWLQRRGWLVLPVYDYSGLGDGKAPKLQGDGVSLVTPDLLAARDGSTKWFEVKHKTRADWTRITGRLETGIDLRLWNHYVRVRASTGCEVWIVFVHEHEDEIRAGEIGALDAIKRESPRFNNGRGGVFWAWDSLTPMAKWSDVKREIV